MEGYIRASGKTVEDAILDASIQLGTTSDNIEYRIIEHETKGFLGLGARKAVIEAKVKKSDEEYVEEVMEGAARKAAKKTGRIREKAEKTDRTEKTEKAEKKAARKENQGENKEAGAKKTAGKETAGKETDKKEADKKAAREKAREKAKDKAEIKETREEKSKEAKEQKEKEEMMEDQSLGMETEMTTAAAGQEDKAAGEKSVREHAPRESANPEVVRQRALDFLTSVFDAMDLEAQIEMSFENDILSIELSGDDMGVLIGKRGQTLDSLQYLTSLVVNKGKSAYVRVKLDTENYRERRRATLENLAKNIAFKVKKTRKSVYLEPMNPYERRIIHSALQNDPYVTTHSEGEEPLRKVVVTLKKRDKYAEEEE